MVRFFHALFAEGNPKDAVALYSFNYQVTLHNFFTHNQGPLEHSLEALRARPAHRSTMPSTSRPGTWKIATGAK